MENTFEKFINKCNDIEKEYFESLNDCEKDILLLAYNHLGTSFDLIKSIGFLKFLDNNEKQKIN